MQRISYIKPGIFSDRKVSVDQAMNILRNNGIETNEEQAKAILDFLYLLAKMHRDRNSQDTLPHSISLKGFRTPDHTT